MGTIINQVHYLLELSGRFMSDVAMFEGVDYGTSAGKWASQTVAASVRRLDVTQLTNWPQWVGLIRPSSSSQSSSSSSQQQQFDEEEARWRSTSTSFSSSVVAAADSDGEEWRVKDSLLNFQARFVGTHFEGLSRAAPGLGDLKVLLLWSLLNAGESPLAKAILLDDDHRMTTTTRTTAEGRGLGGGGGRRGRGHSLAPDMTSASGGGGGRGHKKLWVGSLLSALEHAWDHFVHVTSKTTSNTSSGNSSNLSSVLVQVLSSLVWLPALPALVTALRENLELASTTTSKAAAAAAAAGSSGGGWDSSSSIYERRLNAIKFKQVNDKSINDCLVKKHDQAQCKKMAILKLLVCITPPPLFTHTYTHFYLCFVFTSRPSATFCGHRQRTPLQVTAVPAVTRLQLR
jgi:hypothetical protein